MSRRNANTADEVARTRKILDKKKPWMFTPHSQNEMKLRSPVDSQLGEHAVIAMVGSVGAHLYVICRPIGITDLAKDDWIMIPQDQIAATLTRREDPEREKVNKARQKFKTDALVEAKLLSKKMENGTPVIYYPEDNVTPRNSHLATATAAKKAAIKALKEKLNQKTLTGPEKNEIHLKINAAQDVANYLSDDTKAAELAIRQAIANLGLEEKARKAHPNLWRTLTGSYGDRKQTAITGARGLPIVQVTSLIRKLLATELDLTPLLSPSKKESGKD